MNDYYADLGVARDATAEDIKRAYRKSARRYHPDVNPGPEAEEQFKKLSQAYDVLSDPDKKQAYDLGSDPYAAGAAGFGAAGSMGFAAAGSMGFAAPAGACLAASPEAASPGAAAVSAGGPERSGGEAALS